MYEIENTGPSTSKTGEDLRHLGISPYQQIIASCSGALITSLFVTPLDVVKVRLQKQVRNRQFTAQNGSSFNVTPLDVVKVRIQAQSRPLVKGRCFVYSNGLWDHLCTCVDNGLNNGGSARGLNHHVSCPWYARPSHFTGTVDAFVKIARTEGIRSLWSGLSPTLVMAIPATTLYFTLYDRLNFWLKKQYGPSLWMPMIAGSSARSIAVIAISPFEMIRTKLQSQKLSYLEVGTAVKVATQNNGWSALWRGLGPTLLRDVPFSAFYWMSYERLKQDLMYLSGRSETNFGISFVSGAIGGALASMLTLPFDVIKTHVQIEIGERETLKNSQKLQASTFELMLKICRENGVRSLFAGAVPRLIKVAPACAIMIGTYEYGKTFFYHKNRRSNDSN